MWGDMWMKWDMGRDVKGNGVGGGDMEGRREK